jgi:protein SCO1/2
MTRVLACLAALGIAGSAHAGGAEDLLGSREKFLQPKLGARLSRDLTFTDSTGKKVTLGDYGKDRPYILVLAYYKCPMLCTLVLNDLVASLRRLPFDAGREYEVVVISFDPSEKPELAAAKKAAYVEEYGRPGGEAGFHFLTGDQEQINRIMDETGFRAVWDERQKQYAHARAIMIVSPYHLLTRYFLDGAYPPRDLRLALIESSEGKVGSPMDRILLMCFNYDPVEARYSVAVLNVVQLGGLVTVALIGGFWLVAWWRRRAPRQEVAAHG